MFTRSRRFPPPPTPSSASEKRSSSVSENVSKKKVNAAVKTQPTKKRPALADVSNNRNASIAKTFGCLPPKPLVPCISKTAKTKKDSIASSQKKVISGNTVQASASLSLKSRVLALSKDAYSTGTKQPKTGVEAFLAPSTGDAVCPNFDRGICKSLSSSVSLDESMSTSDSLMSLEFEYVDNGDVVLTKSIENRTCSILSIPDSTKIAGRKHGSDIIMKREANEVVDIDSNINDPQFCASFAHEIYEHLRVTEEIRRPSMDFLEKIQKELNASMRAILIDWLVEVSEEYRLLPDTLFLTVNYVDRYLSGKAINRQRLQLLGVACMMIAAKYEEICAPKVEDFCYVTDNTYSREQVLEMESAVLDFLKFEMTAPTTRCFLRRFIIVAQQTCEVPLLRLEYLADYLTELSLIEYEMLKYKPSLIAASATFLAKYILLPRKKPWNSMLGHYTGYQASELRECVKQLHWLFCNGCLSLPAIRTKYSQHKFKFVAKKYCPSSIPVEMFKLLWDVHFDSFRSPDILPCTVPPPFRLYYIQW